MNHFQILSVFFHHPPHTLSLGPKSHYNWTLAWHKFSTFTKTPLQLTGVGKKIKSIFSNEVLRGISTTHQIRPCSQDYVFLYKQEFVIIFVFFFCFATFILLLFFYLIVSTFICYFYFFYFEKVKERTWGWVVRIWASWERRKNITKMYY